MFYFKITYYIYIYIYSIQLHNDLKQNFSDIIKHLRDFLNEGKYTLILTLFYTCTEINLKTLSLYTCLARAGIKLLLFVCVIKLRNAMGIMPNSYLYN